MFLDKQPYTFDKVVRIGITVLLVWGTVKVLGYLSDVLIPFVVAGILAYFINPLVELIDKKLHNRRISVILSLVLLLLFIAGLFWVLVPIIIGEMSRMSILVSNVLDNDEFTNTFQGKYWYMLQDYLSRPEIQKFFNPDTIYKLIESIFNKMFPGVWSVITGTATFLIGILGLSIVALYMLFLLWDYQKFVAGWKDLLPSKYKEHIILVIRDFKNALDKYFRAQALIAFLVGILFAIGFSIIGLPLGVMLGLFMGLLNLVPYLQIIGFLPAVVLVVLHVLDTGQNFWYILGLTVLVIGIVQTIQDTILVPKIMGRVMRLSPVIILLSLSIWGKFLGFFGLIIAIPATCLVIAYYRKFLLLDISK